MDETQNDAPFVAFYDMHAVTFVLPEHVVKNAWDINIVEKTKELIRGSSLKHCLRALNTLRHFVSYALFVLYYMFLTWS